MPSFNRRFAFPPACGQKRSFLKGAFQSPVWLWVLLEKGFFERFDDKTVLIIGAGEMAEETLIYLKDEGVKHIVVVNRSLEMRRNWR